MTPAAGIHATLAAARVGPIQFDTPIWLWLIPILGALTVWIGRRSLSGMGTTPRRVALLMRLIVIVLLAGAMAEPQWRDEAEAVAVNVILDASRSIPLERQTRAEQYVQAARTANPRPGDRLGVITVAVNAYVQSLPRTGTGPFDRGYIGAAEGTNLASAVRLGLAIKDQNAAYRIVLVTDGNETVGSLLEAAETAKAAGVPIDVLPVVYKFDSEVIADSLVTPATARMGETINVKVVLDATRPTRGKLNIMINGEPVDLDPDADGLGVDLVLPAGRSVHAVPVKLPRAGPQQFRAVFEPAGAAADVVMENNEALAVTFVTSEGKVLVVANPGRPEEFEPLVNALTEAKIATEVIGPEQLPASLTLLNAYDAVILVNQAAYDYTQQAQQDLRQYVHDTGGGLVMIGGDQAFGAGGWIGSPLEDALPIKLDPPQKRQMPRGALALVMHSIEMPDGRFYGMKVAEAAVDALSRLDLVGINEYDYRAGGSAWVYKLSEIGDGAAVKRAIKNLTFGDMPDYAPSLEMALQALKNADAGAKHVIMISDGDAAPPSTALLQQYKKNRITISTVGVYPHGMGDLSRMKWIADQTGGKFYEVVNTGALAKIHQIFIKEAQTVKRSLIWEGDPFSPAVVPLPIESMRGLSSVAPVRGYVVAADREGPVFVTLRGKENDPILASWQHGLGKVVTFTSDASTRWAAAWVAWVQFRQFWEQHVRWAMRPSGSAYARVTTEKDGDRTKVIVELIDPGGERLNFARFQGRVAAPNGEGADIELREVGMGRYEGSFESGQPGSYVVSLRYAAPSPSGTGTTEGSVQAAVSRPFADEFRALTDNAPLLRQVAAMTGGQVLKGDPAADELWRRDGLTMPVTTIPAWHVFALTGIGLFLMDVGVRRVRVDLRAMGLALVGAVRRSKTKAGEQMGSLRAARESARQKMAQRASGPETSADAQALQEAAKASAGVKFEASPEALKRRGEAVTIGPGADKPQAVPGAKPDAVPKEEGLSRLMKAKRRAQDEMGEA